MKTHPIEVERFYESLEKIKSLDIWILNETIEYTDFIEDPIKKEVSIERKILNLQLHKGNLITNYQSVDTEGKVNNFHYISEEDEDYIKRRLAETHNSFLKSRYAHILWQKTKNNSFASIAIESYESVLLEIKADERHFCDTILYAIILLSQSTKYRISEIGQFIQIFINSSEVWLKNQILTIVLETKFFSKYQLNEICNDILNWITDDNYFLNKDVLNNALLAFKKVSLPNSNIYNLLAINENLLLAKHTEEDNFLRTVILGQKAQYYKKAKNLIEYDKTMSEFNKAKRTTRLKKVSVDLNQDLVEKFNKYLDEKSKIILRLEPESILAYFACDEDILVDLDEVKTTAEKNLNDSIRSLFTVNTFDINNNIKKLSDKEKLEQEVLNHYSIGHNIKFYALFIKVFFDGIVQGKINYYKVHNFFSEYTWYGEKHDLNIKRGQDDNSTWLSMLSPGIYNFFTQFELSVLMKTNKVNNFILCIDSLTLKFEGALRDFIRLVGGNTTTEKNDQHQEQLLDQLIDNPKSKEFFSDRDIALFKFTFTKDGINIRNNVAHSFFRYTDYSLQNISLIFLCLLRLGQYQLNDSKGNPEA